MFLLSGGLFLCPKNVLSRTKMRVRFKSHTHTTKKSIDGVNLPLQGAIIYIIKLHCALSAKGYHDSQVFYS